jgi:hypothetical protein
LVQDISTSLAEVEIEQASAQAREAKDAMACQTEVVSPMAVAALMQLSGAVHHFNGETQKALDAFTWAVSASPGTNLDATYGDEASALFATARETVLGTQPGKMVVIGDVSAWIDGQSIQANAPLSVPVGTHLLQWREGEEGTLQSRVILVDPSEERHIKLGDAPVATGAVGGITSSPTSVPSATSRWLILGGGGLILAGGGSWLVSTSAQSAFESETDPAALEDHQSRANAFASIAAVAVLSGGGTLAASFLLDGSTPLGLALSPTGIEATLAW